MKTNKQIKDMKISIISRIPVPFNLTRKQYVDLRFKYMSDIVSARRELKPAFDTMAEAKSIVLSCRRKLIDAETRLVETFDRLEKVDTH